MKSSTGHPPPLVVGARKQKSHFSIKIQPLHGLRGWVGGWGLGKKGGEGKTILLPEKGRLCQAKQAQIGRVTQKKKAWQRPTTAMGTCLSQDGLVTTR